MLATLLERTNNKDAIRIYSHLRPLQSQTLYLPYHRSKQIRNETSNLRCPVNRALTNNPRVAVRPRCTRIGNARFADPRTGTVAGRFAHTSRWCRTEDNDRFLDTEAIVLRGKKQTVEKSSHRIVHRTNPYTVDHWTKHPSTKIQAVQIVCRSSRNLDRDRISLLLRDDESSTNCSVDKLVTSNSSVVYRIRNIEPNLRRPPDPAGNS